MKLTYFALFLALPVLSQQNTQNPWERLSEFDRNKDGKVSREEFQGPERFFERFDSNKDGFVTQEEARAMRGRPGIGPGPMSGRDGLNPMLLMRIDANRDEAVSLDEWTDFFKKADENGDEILQPEEWLAAVRQQPFKDSAPALGSPAPRFKAQSLNSDREVDLANIQRPTVLIFGSHT